MVTTHIVTTSMEALAVCVMQDTTAISPIAVGYSQKVEAAIIIHLPPPTDCENGDLRLVNGQTETEGRIEVCINDSYATICDNRWDELDAIVACRQLGFSSTSM